MGVLESIIVYSLICSFFIFLIQSAELFDKPRAIIVEYLNIKKASGNPFIFIPLKWMFCPFCLAFVLSLCLAIVLNNFFLPVTVPFVVKILYRAAYGGSVKT